MTYYILADVGEFDIELKNLKDGLTLDEAIKWRSYYEADYEVYIVADV